MESAVANPPRAHSLLVLGKSLGSGAFGTINEARWGNQPCAAKSFFLSETELHKDAIQKEISLLQTLRHRHIIQFYRTHHEGGKMYLLMELAEKGSLSRAIAKGELDNDWPTKTRIAHEVARGLAFIHQENVLHRDLKSANVLLTRHMEVKLGDFGLAKVQSMASAASQAGGGLTGTLRWIAPELLYAAKPKYSVKTDVFALGMVMWEMAANCTRPFKDQENDALVALAVSSGTRETIPADTPTEYRDLIERCWHQDPACRPVTSEVNLVPEEMNEACADSDALSFVDLSITDSDLTDFLTMRDDSHSGLVKKAAQEDTEQFVGRLPSTDDDVVAHLSMVAKRGNVDAQMFLGWIYGNGHGVDKSAEDSFWWYRQAASQGPVVAQLRVAKMYEQGHGVEVSDEKAASWYRRAADGGGAEAQFQLAGMYDKGRGVKEDVYEAIKWYRKAADQGHIDAQYTVGIWYSLGRGVLADDDEAHRWFSKAAGQGHVAAQFDLESMYGQGRGVEEDSVTSAKQSTKAAHLGDTSAQCELGTMYKDGLGVEQSDVMAAKWYAKAADQGNATAQCNLGQMYKEGRGVKQSTLTAVTWLTRAAEQGDAKAPGILEQIFTRGGSVAKDDVTAIKWLTKTAEQGHAWAQCALGRLYQVGRGVEKSDKIAVHWFTKAAAQGSEEARMSLALM